MKTALTPLAVALVVVVSAAALGSSKQARAAEVLIGAGDESPVHYNVGRALCRALATASQPMTCEVERIEGRDAPEPLAVLGEVRNNAIDIGIAPSDWLHHAYNSMGPVEFMDINFDNLRVLLSLHSQPFTLIARRDSGIASLDDLAGKRVNIGVPGSDERLVMQQVMAAKGWFRDSFSLADELTGAEQSLALCHDRIQAMVAIVSHPNNALGKTMELCDAELIPVTGDEIGGLVEYYPYFAITEIPAGTYEGQDKAVETFGVKVVLVVSEDMAEQTAYDIVTAVFSSFERFKRLHPALRYLELQDMNIADESAPMHPGAVRKFNEMGM